MLVVDRREGEGAYNPAGAYGTVQAALEQHVLQSPVKADSHVIPAQVEVETPPREPQLPPGVPTVVQTPGQAAILKLLTERVWGVTVS